MSSFGNAPSRQKSIDVEFNLLRSWSGARLDLQRRLARRAGLAIAVALVGAVVVPTLASARGEAATLASAARARTREVEATAKVHEERAAAVAPAIERDAEILASARRVNALLAGLAGVLNASPDTLLVRSLQFEVTAGELTVRLRAEAPDAETARIFARRVGTTPGITAAKASSIAEGTDGVSFDFTCTGGLP